MKESRKKMERQTGRDGQTERERKKGRNEGRKEMMMME